VGVGPTRPLTVGSKGPPGSQHGVPNILLARS
jgi:hypothetical protein